MKHVYHPVVGLLKILRDKKYLKFKLKLFPLEIVVNCLRNLPQEIASGTYRIVLYVLSLCQELQHHLPVVLMVATALAE